MKKVFDYIKTHKELIIIIFIVSLLIANQFLKSDNSTNLTPLPTPTTKQAPYKTVVPGLSTEEQLNNLMGDPLSSKNEGDKKVSEYKSTSQYRNNEGVVEGGKVSFIKVIVTNEDNKKVSDITDVYGKAPYKLYEESPYSTFNLYVYPNKGLAYLGHADGTLLEIWYFVPTSIEDFIKKWGSGYSLTQNKAIPSDQTNY